MFSQGCYRFTGAVFASPHTSCGSEFWSNKGLPWLFLERHDSEGQWLLTQTPDGRPGPMLEHGNLTHHLNISAWLPPSTDKCFSKLLFDIFNLMVFLSLVAVKLEKYFESQLQWDFCQSPYWALIPERGTLQAWAVCKRDSFRFLSTAGRFCCLVHLRRPPWWRHRFFFTEINYPFHSSHSHPSTVIALRDRVQDLKKEAVFDRFCYTCGKKKLSLPSGTLQQASFLLWEPCARAPKQCNPTKPAASNPDYGSHSKANQWKLRNLDPTDYPKRLPPAGQSTYLERPLASDKVLISQV